MLTSLFILVALSYVTTCKYTVDTPADLKQTDEAPISQHVLFTASKLYAIENII